MGARSGFAPLTAFERGGAQRKRGGAPRKAIDQNNDRTNDSGTTASNSNGLTLRKTFAFLRAASALSAMNLF
jgi:hypothetical protein